MVRRRLFIVPANRWAPPCLASSGCPSPAI